MTCSRCRRAIDRVGVVGGDDLALLGELEPAVDRAGRLAEDGPVRRSAAPPDRAAATVEQRQLDASARATSTSDPLRPVEHPGRRQEPRLLVRVGVAEHHLLAIAAAREVGAIRTGRRASPRGSGRRHRAPRSISKSGHDVEDRGHALGGEAGQFQDVGHVARRRREADDDPVAGLDAVARLDRRRSPGTCRSPRRAARRARPRSRVGRRIAARSAARAARWTTACWRISSDARWNPNVPSCQRRSATSPQATRSRPSAISASWSSAQLVVELLGRAISTGQRRRPPRSARPASGAGARR